MKLLTSTALSLLLISLASVSFAHGGRLNPQSGAAVQLYEERYQAALVLKYCAPISRRS
jgi:hypothetical protein